MSFQGKEFTQGMKQLVINLKQFNDIEKCQNNFKAVWSIEQTAKGLDIGEASVRRIIAEYNKNSQSVPDKLPKFKGRPEHLIPKSVQPIVRKYIRSQNLKGQHVSIESVREFLRKHHKHEFATTTIWRALSRWGFTYGTGKRRSALKERDYVILASVHPSWPNYLKTKVKTAKMGWTFYAGSDMIKSLSV